MMLLTAGHRGSHSCHQHSPLGGQEDGRAGGQEGEVRDRGEGIIYSNT